MIFSISDHIQQIIDGTKTRTRRPTDRYRPGYSYSIQPRRVAKGIPDGRIRITFRWHEWKDGWGYPVTEYEAWLEGGYTPEQYEALYERIYSDWRERWAYEFKFIPSGGQP